MLSKDKLIYDATTPADGDSVAAFLRVAAGALTSTGAAGALDVNITNAFAVDVDIDGIYSGGNTDPDNVGVISHVRGAAPADTDQTVRTTGATAASDAVTATDVWGADSNAFGMLFGGTTWDRARGTSGAQHIHDGGNSITVDAVDLDIRDLSSATDSISALGNVADDAVDSGNPVKIGARAVGTALTAVSAGGDRTNAVSDLRRRIYVNDACSVGMNYGANSVTTSAELVATASAGRKRFLVQNLGNKAIYLGGDSSVTTVNGIRVSAGAAFEMDLGEYVDLYMIAESGTQDVRFMQAG